MCRGYAEFYDAVEAKHGDQCDCNSVACQISEDCFSTPPLPAPAPKPAKKKRKTLPDDGKAVLAQEEDAIPPPNIPLTKKGTPFLPFYRWYLFTHTHTHTHTLTRTHTHTHTLKEIAAKLEAKKDKQAAEDAAFKKLVSGIRINADDWSEDSIPSDL